MDEVKRYINKRYNNWLDFAKHMAKIHQFDGMADDLLHDVIIDILNKDTEKIRGLFARKTTKIIDGEPTTELDKFVLRMLRVNAFSPVAPFRKNTLGHKIINRAGKNCVETVKLIELNGTDRIDETYNPERFDRLDQMHSANLDRLARNGFNRGARELYILHFIQSKPQAEFTQAQREGLTSITRFLATMQKTLSDE